MVFSSVLFLWYFLPAVLVLYFIVSLIFNKNPKAAQRAKNAVLLLASVTFYGLGGYKYLLLLGAVLAINYVGGLLVSKYNRKIILALTVALDLGLLFFFKYLNLFVLLWDNILFAIRNRALGEACMNIITLTRSGELDFISIILPIGISFYIFQSISYVADVYRKDAQVQKNFADYALYVSFFPQLIAGPIVKYSDIDLQIRSRKETVALFSEGVGRFSYGLAKKVLIANSVAQIADDIWALDIDGIGASLAWLGAISYTLQIYFDFSGYSDMAIGLGKMFGFNFKENFNYPYVSGSVQDFWRRWHISLSTWFKEYVYIPLGGSRCSMSKILRNIFIVFLLTGIWHGANFTFILWGLMYAALLIIERLFLGKVLKKNPVKIVNVLYTLFFVIMGWVIFRSENIVQAFTYIGEMFRPGNKEYTILSFLSMKGLIAIAAGIILSMPVYGKLTGLIKKNSKAAAIAGCFETFWQILLLGISLLTIISGSYNPFIYFQF